MISCLVTGGAGFIGSHLVESLLNTGHSSRVRVLDNLSTGKKRNLSAVLDQIEFILGDIRDRALLAEAVQGADVVFHLAAQVFVSQSVADPLTTHEVNATGTLNLLHAAKDAGVRRVVFSSTCAVYGDEPTLPKTEAMRPEPRSPYAVSKLAAEGYCWNYAEHLGLETVALRYFNVYGPRQDPSSPYSGVISIFIDKLLRSEAPTIFGDGEQSRDFVYVSDVVEANLLAAERSEAAGKVINIGTGQPTTINQLFQATSRLMGKAIPPRTSNPRPGDIRFSYADVGLARKYLGWQAQTSLRDGLRRTIEAAGTAH